MISKRVQGFTESVIREMTRVNNQYDGINLAQGMPNFPPPRELVEAAHRAIDGDFHQYAITWGAPRLRQAIAEKYRKFYGREIQAARHLPLRSTPRPPPDRRAAGHGRPHRDHPRQPQGLLGDRLAGRLRGREPRAVARHKARPRLHHRRGAAPAPGSRGHRARPARLVLRASAGELPGPARSPAGQGGGGGLRRLQAPRRVLHPHRGGALPEALRLQGRPRAPPPPGPGGRGRHRAGLVLLRPPPARADQEPPLLPQDRRHADRGGAPAAEARPLPLREAATSLLGAGRLAADVAPLGLRAAAARLLPPAGRG